MSKKASREGLVDALQLLAEEIDRTPRIADMDEHGAYSRGPYQRAFASWNAALEAAGLQVNKPQDISRQSLIDALNDLAGELGHTPTRKEMNEYGAYSRGPYDREFGSWNDALAAAGFDVNKPVRLNREELLSELGRLAEEIGRVPRQKDMNDRGNYSVRAYKREWENWNAALRAAGFEPNKVHDEKVTLTCEWCNGEFKVKPALKYKRRFCDRECEAEWKSENYDISTHPHPNAGERITLECEWCGDEFERSVSAAKTARFCDRKCLGKHHRQVRSGENSPRWRGGYEEYYGPNWRKQRRRRKEKDNYTCQRCGTTEDLVVHHRTAFREFAKEKPVDYESAHALDNLITLCRTCHAIIENGAANGFGGNQPPNR